jgi:hypothetical protein
MVNNFTATDARQVFNVAIANAKDADQIAKIELLREYFTNPDFRKFMESSTFAINQKNG